MYSFLYSDPSVPSVIVFVDSASPPSWLSSVAVKYKARARTPPLTTPAPRGERPPPSPHSPRCCCCLQSGKKKTVNFGFVGKDVEPARPQVPTITFPLLPSPGEPLRLMIPLALCTAARRPKVRGEAPPRGGDRRPRG